MTDIQKKMFDVFLAQLRQLHSPAERLQFVCDNEKDLEKFTSRQLEHVAAQLIPRPAKQEYPMFSELPLEQQLLERSMIMTDRDRKQYEIEVEGKNYDEGT